MDDIVRIELAVPLLEAEVLVAKAKAFGIHVELLTSSADAHGGTIRRHECAFLVDADHEAELRELLNDDGEAALEAMIAEQDEQARRATLEDDVAPDRHHLEDD